MPGSSSYSMDLPWPTLEKSFRDGSSPDVRDFPAPAQERAPERRDAQRGSSRGFVGDFATGSASSAHSGEHPPTPLGKSEVETGVPGDCLCLPHRPCKHKSHYFCLGMPLELWRELCCSPYEIHQYLNIEDDFLKKEKARREERRPHLHEVPEHSSTYKTSTYQHARGS